jgi:hypothetical protein
MTTVMPDSATALDLASASAFLLESYTDLDSVLSSAITLEKTNDGWLPLDTLQRIVEAYEIRTVRLIGKPGQYVDELDTLRRHIGKLTARASFRIPPDTHRNLYDKLKTLNNLIEISISLKSKENESRGRPKSNESTYWPAIGSFLLSAKHSGKNQASISDHIATLRDGNKLSRGAVSLILTAMRNAGWLITTTRGKENIHFPGPTLLEQSLALQLESKTNSSELKLSAYINLMVWTQCYNQGRILEFNALSGALHKGLRKSVSRIFSQIREYTDPSFLSDCTYEEIRAKAKTLDIPKHYGSQVDEMVEKGLSLSQYISKTMQDICQINFKYLQHYFKLRGSKFAPRISLKGFFPTPGDNNQQRLVTTLYGTSATQRPPSAFDESSTFRTVFETGKFKLVNDLPRETLEGTYNSSRFDPERLANYRRDPVKYSFEQCFRDHNSAPETKFYRSSLVVPISLKLNEGLSTDFKEIWQRNFERESNSDGSKGLEGRLIFGFLCIDHVEANFFQHVHIDPTEINIVYYFADILSHYLFQRASLTVGSEQFHFARAILGKENESRLRVEAPRQSVEVTFESSKPPEIDESFVRCQVSSHSNIIVTDQVSLVNTTELEEDALAGG